MKHKFLLKTMLLLSALIAGSGSVWATENDVHDMSITQSTSLNNNASIPSINIDAQDYSVKKVTINWRYNKTIENPVTIEVLVGGDSWGTQTITGNTTADAVFEGESTTGAIVISFTNNTGSGTGHGTFYVNSVKLTEGASSSPATPYTVTLGDNSATLTEESGGAGVTLPLRSNVGSYTFAGWVTSEITTETTTAPTIIAVGTYHPTSDITLYPVYTRTETGGETTTEWHLTELNAVEEGVYVLLTTDYHAFNGNISSGHGQITTNAFSFTSGVATSAPTGVCELTFTSVTGGFTMYNELTSKYLYASAASSGKLAWNDSESSYWSYSSSNWKYNANGAYLRAYNNNSFRTYGANNGDLLKLAKKVEASASTTYYISTPSGQEKVITPTITIPAGAFVSTKTVTISCETVGASITYSTDGGTNWTSYSAPFTINATTTVQAKATKSGMDDSDVTTATFTKETVLEGLSALAAETNTSDATKYVSLTNAQVTWVGTQGNNSTPIGYMEDSTTGIYLYNYSATLNNVYNGIFQVTYQLFNSMPEIKDITAVEGTTAVGNAKDATVMTAAALDEAFNANLSRQIQINGFAVTSAKQLTENIDLYETSPYTEVTASKTYNLVGYPFNSYGTKQFRITSASEVQKLDNAIIMVAEAYTIDIALTGAGSVNMTSVAANHGTLQSEIYSSTIDAANYTWGSNVLNVFNGQNGVIVIRYFVEADAEYNGVEKFVTVTVVDDPVIGYEGATESTPYGTPYIVDEDLINGGTVSLVSGNIAVATVDGLTITPVAAGTVTITVNTADADIWHAGSATFTLNITQPDGETTAKPADDVVLFHETFGDNSGSARDWDDDYSVKSGINAVYSGIEGYTISNARQSKNTMGSSASGLTQTTAGTDAYIIIGPLDVEDYENMTLTYKWKAASIKNDYSTSASYATSSTGDYADLTLNDGTGVGATSFVECAYSLPEEAQVSSLYLKIVWNTSNTQAIIDEVNLSIPGAATESVTLNGSGYATFCSQYPLDFSDYATADYSAWQITDISSTNVITFTQITSSVKGGTGILLKGTPSATVTITSTDSDNTLDDNLLEGTLAPTYVAAGKYYGLSGSTFVKVNAGTVPAGKALLDKDWITEGSGVKAFTFVFEDDDATGVETIENGQLTNDNEIYNLAGQRLQKMQKGINIVNGKKVLF